MATLTEAEVRALVQKRKIDPITEHDPQILTAWQVRDIRERLGMTQEQIADELGVFVRTYQRWEKGGITLQGSKAMRLLVKDRL